MVMLSIKGRRDIIMKHKTFLQEKKTQEFAKFLARCIYWCNWTKNCENLSDVQNPLKELFKGTLEEMLESDIYSIIKMENIAV